MGDDAPQRGDIGLDAVDVVAAQRTVQPPEGLFPFLAPGYHFGQQRLVVGGHLVARVQAAVHSYVLTRGLLHVPHHARRGQERLGVFGIDARLDSVPVEPHVFLGEGQCLACRDPHLQLRQVQARYHLGDPVLHLETHIHLQEVDGPIPGDQKLHRPRVGVADVTHESQGILRQALPLLGRQLDGRAFLQDLLVAPLDRAVPLVQVHHVAVFVSQDLHLQVPCALQERLHVKAGAAEGLLGQPARLPHDPW